MPPAALRDPNDRFWIDTKVSDDLLDPIFAAFYERLGLPNLLRKTDYHQLATYVPPDQLPAEVSDVLDLIAEMASRAVPGERTS